MVAAPDEINVKISFRGKKDYDDFLFMLISEKIPYKHLEMESQE